MLDNHRLIANETLYFNTISLRQHKNVDEVLLFVLTINMVIQNHRLDEEYLDDCLLGRKNTNKEDKKSCFN